MKMLKTVATTSVILNILKKQILTLKRLFKNITNKNKNYFYLLTFYFSKWSSLDFAV